MLDPRDDGLLQDLLDGRLTAAEAEEVHARFATEPELADAWAELLRLRELLREETVAPPVDLLGRVREAIGRPAGDASHDGEVVPSRAPAAAPRSGSPAPRPRWVRALAFAYAAAAVLVVGLVTSVLLTSQRDARSGAPAHADRETVEAAKDADAPGPSSGPPPAESTRRDGLEPPRGARSGPGVSSKAPPAPAGALAEDKRDGQPGPEPGEGGKSAGGSWAEEKPGALGAPAPEVIQPGAGTAAPLVYLVHAPTHDAGRAEVALLVAGLRAERPRDGLALLREAYRSPGDGAAVPPGEAPPGAPSGAPGGTHPPALDEALARRISRLAGGEAVTGGLASERVLALDVDLTPGQAERLARLVALGAPPTEGESAEAADLAELAAGKRKDERPGDPLPAPSGGAAAGDPRPTAAPAPTTPPASPPPPLPKGMPVAEPPPAPVPRGPAEPRDAEPSEASGGAPPAPDAAAPSALPRPPPPTVRVRFLVLRDPP